MTPITEPAPLSLRDQLIQAAWILGTGVPAFTILFIIGDWWAL